MPSRTRQLTFNVASRNLHHACLSILPSMFRQLRWTPSRASTGGAPLRTRRYEVAHVFVTVIICLYCCLCNIHPCSRKVQGDVSQSNIVRDAAEYTYTTSPRNFTAAQISKLKPVDAQSNATFCVACERSTAFTMSVIGEKNR